MKILVATKRHYTGKDLIDHRYGRLYEIPEALANQGHQVNGVALSYRGQREALHQPGKVAWHALSALPFEPYGALRYLRRFSQLVDAMQPDVVWASSDAWHAIAAEIVCRSRGVPLVVDLYDNYESFNLTRIPGVKSNFVAACKAAAALTVVSSTLEEMVIERYGIAKPVAVVGNAVDTAYFFPRDKGEARRSLGLPAGVRIIGTAGALAKNRGIEDLFAAFDLLSRRHEDLYLALAGPRDRSVSLRAHERILDLGMLSSSEIPLFWSALDAAVVCNKDSDFGRYCYPQKFQEIVACDLPFVAADVGEMARICRDDSSFLYRPGSAESLADRLESALSLRKLPPTLRAIDWSERATVVGTLLDRASRLS